MNTLKMNALTPRTDKAVQESNGQWSFAMRNLCIQMECELTEVITERDELVAKYRMHHDEAERLTREIAEARDQRDKWAYECGENMKLLKEAIATGTRAIEQRDTLAEACSAIEHAYLEGSDSEWGNALMDIRQALAAVKGGSDE
jgi:uncharacterized coiled-coil DUF342 family protein